MKALYVATAYDRHPDDVITPWLVETIQHLKQRGVEVEVLAPAYRGLGTQTVGGVRVHRFRYAPAPIEDLTHDETAPDRVRHRPWYLGLVPAYVASGMWKAARLAGSGGFDLVHVHWPIPHALIGMAARRSAGIPLVCTFHGVELTWTRRQLKALLPFLRHVVKTSDAVTANSSYTAGLIREVYDRPVERIPFGATIAAPAATEDTAAAGADDAFEILVVGRLVERKGVRYLLNAAARLRGRHDITLHIVGDGPLRSALETQARELGLEDAARFHGFVSDDELAKRFAACDVFVLPAVIDRKGDVEGLGVVLIEALMYGKPVIASEAGGIVDIVKHEETGLLVPPGDAEALTEAIRTVIENPELARSLGRSGREYADREFSWDAVTGRLIALYERLV